MTRSLCLNHQCAGMVTRIECVIRPLASGNGMWTLLFAAGMEGDQPSMVRAQGPFPGPFAAESVLESIAQSLGDQGYQRSDATLTWHLHLQSQLRNMRGKSTQSSFMHQL